MESLWQNLSNSITFGLCLDRSFDRRTPRQERRGALLAAMERCEAQTSSGGHRTKAKSAHGRASQPNPAAGS
jgi:hypothetical protein